MAVRSRRFFGPTKIATAGAVVLYTVPADRTALIRTLVLANGTAAATGLTYLLVNGSSGADNAVWVGTVGANSVTFVTADLILNPGDVLRGYVTSSACQFSAFGSLLDGPPT